MVLAAITLTNPDFILAEVTTTSAGRITLPLSVSDQLIEAPGFLADKNDETSLVKEMKSSELEMWEEKVEGRMKRKILALRKLFQEGECEVYISDGRVDKAVRDALDKKGSVIT